LIIYTITILIIYIDDLVLAGNSIDEIDQVKHFLSSNFDIRDLRKVRYFLRIEVAHLSFSISLCQRQYCLDLIKDADLLNSKSCSSPMNTFLCLVTLLLIPYHTNG